MDKSRLEAFSAAKKILSIMLVVAIFSFFAYRLYASWNQVEFSGFRWEYALLSMAGVLASLLFMSVVYYFILWFMKFDVKPGETIASHVIGDFASYFPGKVWNVLARWKVLKGKVRIADSVVAITIEALALILAAGIILVFWFLAKENIAGKYAVYVYILIPVIIILVHPRIVEFFANIAMRLLKKEPVKVPITYRQVLLIVILCAAYWAINGISFFFALKSIGNAPYSLLPVIAAANMIAWVIGFLSTLTPAGLGIKEGAIVFLLAGYFSEPLLIAASVLFRLFSMLMLLLAVIAITCAFIRIKKLKSIKYYFSGEKNEEA